MHAHFLFFILLHKNTYEKLYLPRQKQSKAKINLLKKILFTFNKAMAEAHEGAPQ